MFEEKLLEGSGPIRSALKKRMDSYERKTVNAKLVDDFYSQGWEEDRPLKYSTRIRRAKSHDVRFEDRVWSAFARMGFTRLNLDRNLAIPYGRLESEKKQVDVLAADDDVVLVIECKSSEQPRTEGFKSEIEAIVGRRAGMIRTLRSAFPHHKVQFILATNNFNLSSSARERIETSAISYIDEEVVDYFHELATHLGSAARYQVLGNLLGDTKIESLDNVVPAIQSKMGGITYYSFSIEPEKLLKMSYVLHRSKAASDVMPTYQRIVKRSRLRQVQEFVNQGGMFPNSIILNIDSGKRIRFDRVAGGSESSSLGMLHLPRTYRSAYVIDGQHRLYGYAGSRVAATDKVPVVAFVNMERESQVELFMQINENQKAVPKNLRNTLDADLLWTSESLRDRDRAIRLRAAQFLGERKGAALRGRVILGENAPDELRCITIEAISLGLANSKLLGSFTKTEVKHHGLLYTGNSRSTYDGLTALLDWCFAQLADLSPDQWALGRSDGGLLFMNVGVNATIRVIGDFVEHATQNSGVGVPVRVDDELRSILTPLVRALAAYINGLSYDDRAELRRNYGTAGPKRLWRQMQAGVRERVPEFQPAGLDEYLADQKKEHKVGASENVGVIEQLLNEDVASRLEREYGHSWFKKGVPAAVVKRASALAVEKSLAAEDDVDVEPWTCLYLVDYKEIMSKDHGQWQALFESTYTRPEEVGSGGSWKTKLDWLVSLNTIRNKASHVGGQVTADEFAFTLEIRQWLEGKLGAV